jgi:hypothetical protein
MKRASGLIEAVRLLWTSVVAMAAWPIAEAQRLRELETENPEAQSAIRRRSHCRASKETELVESPNALSRRLIVSKVEHPKR